jgi:hypothetical protein
MFNSSGSIELRGRFARFSFFAGRSRCSSSFTSVFTKRNAQTAAGSSFLFAKAVDVGNRSEPRPVDDDWMLSVVVVPLKAATLHFRSYNSATSG